MDNAQQTIANIKQCLTCNSINTVHKSNSCRRCGQKICTGYTQRINASWALLITGIIAYIPANLYPMLVTEKFNHQFGSTIIEGVLILWENGSYPIAVVIFLASIFIPILKFSVLGYLLLSEQYAKNANKTDKQSMHRITRAIGPWSMIDVFVVAILVSLIDLSSVKVIPGSATTAFAISVLFTLFAVRRFETQTIK